MAEPRWYNLLIARLMKEQNMSEYALARAARLSHIAVRNARTGAHYISMETLEKVLAILGFKIEPVHLPPPPSPPPKPEVGEVVLSTPPKHSVAEGELDSYCWGCGKENTMRNVHGHLQCNRCGYVDPCCED